MPLSCARYRYIGIKWLIIFGMDESETKLSLARLFDLSEECEERNYLTHSFFFGFSELSALLPLLGNGREINGVPYLLYGGEKESERKLFVFLPPYLNEDEFLRQEASEESLLTCLHIYPKAEKFAFPLSHRDYLGALLSLGIERKCIGDIYVGEKEAYAYVISSLTAFIKENLKTVGRNSVKVDALSPFSCPLANEFVETRLPVSSLRLDCLLAAAFKISREEAKKQIEAGNVFLTSSSCKSDALLKEGEHVSLQGKGKFIYVREDGTTKKGKIVAIIKTSKQKR